MSSEQFKSWMQRMEKTVSDIAYESKLAPDTIRRFMKGLTVHRSTKLALEHYVAQVERHQSAPPMKAAGR